MKATVVSGSIILCHRKMNCSQATDVIYSNSKSFYLHHSNGRVFTLTQSQPSGPTLEEKILQNINIPGPGSSWVTLGCVKVSEIKFMTIHRSRSPPSSHLHPFRAFYVKESGPEVRAGPLISEFETWLLHYDAVQSLASN